MSKLTIPKNYSSALNLHDTQLAIKTVKDFFQGMLAQRLSLTRVSAPLFVDPTTGLNAHSQKRTILVLSRCFAANFAHMCGGGSIRATLRTRKPAAYMRA